MRPRNSFRWTAVSLIVLSLLMPVRGAEPKLIVPELPREIGKSVAIEIRGLPVEATKLEVIMVPRRGAIKPFLLGKYEVTQGQYEAVMGRNPSTFKNGPDYPVEQMSWQDAKDFCAALNTNLPAGAKMSFRLPTDEEWSIAVGLPEEVAGTLKQKSNKIRNVYPWGTNWPPTGTAGNYSDASNRKKYEARMSYVPDLVEKLRAGESSAYTERETPIFTCVAGSIAEVVDMLG